MLPTNTLQGAFLFVSLVLPGYLFLQGYRRGAEIPKERRDLYVIAETITFSIVLLGLAWPLGVDDVLRDIQDGKLLDRGTLGVYALVVATLLGPYVLGVIAGLAAQRLSDLRVLPRPKIDDVEADRHW